MDDTSMESQKVNLSSPMQLIEIQIQFARKDFP